MNHALTFQSCVTNFPEGKSQMYHISSYIPYHDRQEPPTRCRKALPRWELDHMFSKCLFSLFWGLLSCYSTLLWTNIDSQKTPSGVDRCYTFPIGNHGFESSPQGQKTRVPTCCQLVNSRCRADRAWRFALQTEIDHQRYHWNIMGYIMGILWECHEESGL